MRALVFIAVVLAVTGCSGGKTDRSGDRAPTGPSVREVRAVRCNPIQRARATRALRAMRRAARGKVKVERDRCGFVRDFEGRLPAPGPGATRRVLDRYAAAFGLRSTFSELRVNSRTGPIVDLEQVYRRVPLALSPRVTVLFKGGRIASVSSDACPYVTGHVRAPRVSRSDAVAIAAREVPEDPPPSRPLLVVIPLKLSHPCGGGRSVLAWETHAGFRPIWIDATSGHVLLVGRPPIF